MPEERSVENDATDLLTAEQEKQIKKIVLSAIREHDKERRDEEEKRRAEEKEKLAAAAAASAKEEADKPKVVRKGLFYKKG